MDFFDFYSAFVRRRWLTFDCSGLLLSSLIVFPNLSGLLFNFCPKTLVDFWLFRIAPFLSCLRNYQFRVFIRSLSEDADWLLIVPDCSFPISPSDYYSFVLHCLCFAFITVCFSLVLHLLRVRLHCYIVWVFRIGFLYLPHGFFSTYPTFSGQTAETV